MENLIAYDVFFSLTNIQKEEIQEDCLKIIDQQIYLKPQDALHLFLKKIENLLLATAMNGNVLEPIFLEKTIQAITFFYESIRKDENHHISNLLQENQLLKNTLVSLQEECQNHHQQAQELQEEIKNKQEEINFLKKKHQLMWGKVSNMGIKK